jgi:heptosyltransferase-3
MPPEWLILHAGTLGDLVLTIQLALRLLDVNHASALELISRTDPGDLSGCRPAICRQSPGALDVHWLYAESDAPPPQRLRELIAGRRVLNALAAPDSSVHGRLASLRPQALYSFDPRPKPGLDTHIASQWQRDLEAQGLLLSGNVAGAGKAHALQVPDILRSRGRMAYRQRGLKERPILIHPGSGGRAKCWHLPGFLNAAHQLRTDGMEVCFVIGPVERECWPAADLDELRAEFPLIESAAPDELLRLLAAARAFVGNDAGPSHLAAMLGTPTVTLFGSTSPTVWRPLGPKVHVIAGNPNSHPDDWGISPERLVSEVTECVAEAERST